MPFPSKVVARLSRCIEFTEGQHAIVRSQGESRTDESTGIIVRHLSLPSRHEVADKREHGLRRAAAGFSSEIGWQLQRLAHMTDRELDAYWTNNSWHLSDDRRVLVGTYDRLVEDDALVRIGHDLARAGDRFREAPGAKANPVTPFGEIPSRRLERLVDSLVNQVGTADLRQQERMAALHTLQKKFDERTAWALELDAQLRERDQRLVSLAKEYDERTTWALRLNDELAKRDRELVAVRSSTLWRTMRALHLASRPRKASDS
jgi:hypothetical protein